MKKRFEIMTFLFMTGLILMACNDQGKTEKDINNTEENQITEEQTNNKENDPSNKEDKSKDSSNS